MLGNYVMENEGSSSRDSKIVVINVKLDQVLEAMEIMQLSLKQRK